MKRPFSIPPLVAFSLVTGISMLGHAHSALPLIDTTLPSEDFETIGDKLVKEVGQGQSVAVVAGEDGIIAISADGKRRSVIVDSPASWVMVDNRSNVLWFGVPSKRGWPFEHLMALDLAQNSQAAAPVMLAENITERVTIKYKNPAEKLSSFDSEKNVVISVSRKKIHL